MRAEWLKGDKRLGGERGRRGGMGLKAYRRGPSWSVRRSPLFVQTRNYCLSGGTERGVAPLGLSPPKAGGPLETDTWRWAKRGFRDSGASVLPMAKRLPAYFARHKLEVSGDPWADGLHWQGEVEEGQNPSPWPQATERDLEAATLQPSPDGLIGLTAAVVTIYAKALTRSIIASPAKSAGSNRRRSVRQTATPAASPASLAAIGTSASAPAGETIANVTKAASVACATAVAHAMARCSVDMPPASQTPARRRARQARAVSSRARSAGGTAPPQQEGHGTAEQAGGEQGHG